MQHNLGHIIRIIHRKALTPIVRDRIRKDTSIAVERSGGDGTADVGVALEAVLGVLVPEVERPVRPGRAEGAVNGVEGDGVYGIDVGDVAGAGGGFAVAFEGKVGAVR
jgi:hypothetical protein